MPIERRAPLPVRFFRTKGGSEPVREWLLELPEEERKQIGRDLMRLQWGWPVGRPLAAPLGQGLFELRSALPRRQIARLLFFIREECIIAVHGFIKKTQKTPAQDLELARRRKRTWEASNA